MLQRSGRSEIYLLMSVTDMDFGKALDAGNILGLSSEVHEAGTEYGMVSYVVCD